MHETFELVRVADAWNQCIQRFEPLAAQTVPLELADAFIARTLLIHSRSAMSGSSLHRGAH